MLDATFKERVRNLVLPKFEKCIEDAKTQFSKKSAELAARGHFHSGATLTAQHEARVSELENKIKIAWDVLKEVMGVLQVSYSDTLSEDLKAEIENYGSYNMTGVKNVNLGSTFARAAAKLNEEFEVKRKSVINMVNAEVDLLVDGLRTKPQVETRELEQKFKILYTTDQAKKDFDRWAKELESKKASIAVMFLDIDHFKSLNEYYTHIKVDQSVLPQVMTKLRDLINFRGASYRYGGEEFLLILPNHDKTEAEAFGEKVRSTVAGSEFFIDEDTVKVTISIGIALWPQHGQTYLEVLQKANLAEKNAKSSRNSVVMSSAG